MLTHANIQDSGLIRRNRYQIRCDDRHRVIVNHELEVRVNSAVDETYAIRGARSEGGVESESA